MYIKILEWNKQKKEMLRWQNAKEREKTNKIVIF